MSMTKEEAIKRLKDLKARCKRLIVYSERNPEEWRKDAEAIGIALTFLHPVSREQVKRVWYRGSGWKYETKPSDDGGIMYSAVNTCMYCGSETPTGNFCYRCGIAQTDMGVDVVMERLEALKDGKGD